MKPRSVLQIFTSVVFLVSGLLWLTAAMPNLCFAQGLYGSLSGTVSDQSGAAIPSVEVKVTEKKSGAVTVAKTNESGNFMIQNLEPGTYSVQITGAGFATVTQDNIEVVQNSIKRDDVSLNVGKVSQNVVVQAENTLLQTDRADVNETIDAKQIENLPLSTTRNFQNLQALIPGFSAPFSSHSSAGNPGGSIQYNANGISYSVNSTTLDGASDVYQWIPDLALYIPPAESIQSFNVVTANYTADQGSVGGAVTTIITKSGGNQFHGALWEYHVNNALNAKPYFYTAARLPKLISNQFGAEVGGPILHNKLFFFADWERTSQRNGTSAFYTLPTAALISGNFIGTGTTIYDPLTGNAAGQGRTPFLNNTIPTGRLSSAALKLLSYVPTVNVPTGGSVVNDYLFAPSIPSTQDNIDGKLTFNPTDRTTFFAKYSISRKNVLDPQPFGQAGGATTDGGLAGSATGNTQLATLGATHTFTNNFVADGTFGYTRQNIGNLGTDLGSNFGTDVLGIPGTNGPTHLQGGVPGFNLSGFSSYGNGSSNAPFSFRDNQYAFAGTAHWTMRNHTISFGANILYLNMNHFQTTGASFPARGGFTFTGGDTALNGGAAPNLYNSFADFLLGMPNSMGTGAQYTPYVRLDEWEYAAFVEDQWQATRSTTLNYGIRYELYPYEHNPAFGGDVYDPDSNAVLIGGYGGVPFNPGVNTGHGIWLPRVGIAQRLSNKTVIRGGVALSVNPSNFKYAMTTYPFVLQVTYNAPNSFSAAGNLATGIPASPPLPDITTGRVPVPTNFGISSYPRDFNRGHIASYNLDFEQQLLPWMTASVAYVGNSATHQNCIRNINAGEPGLGTAGQPFFQKFGTTTARNLYDPICPSNYNGLHAQLKVNGGGFSGSGIAYAYAKAMDWTEHEDGLLAYSSDDVLDRNNGLNAEDIKHNLHIYMVYQLPFGKGQHWATHGLTSAVFGGWSLANVLTMHSGTPFTVTSSGASLNSPGNTQTANQVKPSVAIYGAHAPGHHYFDPLAFAPVTTATYGNVHLNNLRGPGVFQLDTGLRRRFVIFEQVTGEFLAQAFAITNTPHFGNPGATVSNATFSNGSVTNYNGYDTITTASGNRNLQFGLTIRF